jgi:transposase
VTAEHISQGSLFSTNFLQESIARAADWQLLTDAEIDALAADLRAIFNQFVPTLSPGDIVLIDNLASHKRPKIRKAVEVEGAELRFLPRYSPDLNPIEMAFSKLKTLLRKASERSVEALWTRIGELPSLPAD